MWKYIAFFLLTSLAFKAVGDVPDQNQVAIRVKMLELAGPTAINCGLLSNGSRMRPAWKCAQAADKARRPFWLAVKGQRTDSDVWLAIARGSDSKRYQVFYTSNEAGESQFKPHFSVTACNEPFMLFKSSLFMLRCGPDVP
jgi:hypothetical protein